MVHIEDIRMMPYRILQMNLKSDKVLIMHIQLLTPANM